MKYEVRAVFRFTVPICTILASSGKEAVGLVQDHPTFKPEVRRIVEVVSRRLSVGGLYSYEARSGHDYYDDGDCNARSWEERYEDLKVSYDQLWDTILHKALPSQLQREGTENA